MRKKDCKYFRQRLSQKDTFRSDKNTLMDQIWDNLKMTVFINKPGIFFLGLL